MKNTENYDDKNEENNWNLEEIEKDELKQFDIQLKQYAHHHKMYKRILAVKMVKSGETRIKVAEYLNVNRQTVGRWVRIYDESGFEGLEPDYSNCGAECKLTDEQLAEIQKIITNPKEHYDIKRTRKLIKDKYGIDYTYKQVWIITREKLNLNYRKPYLRFNEAPTDAEDQLKKTSKSRSRK